MKIKIKEIKEDGSEFLIYLTEENNTPIMAGIVNEKEKDNVLSRILEYVKINNQTSNSSINKMSYNEYINQ